MGRVSLDELPVELLLKIFENLDVKFITDVLAQVCCLFRYIIYVTLDILVKPG